MNNETHIELDNFPVMKQETPYTCGPTSVRLVLDYLGHKLDEKDIARKMLATRYTGTLPGILLLVLRYYML